MSKMNLWSWFLPFLALSPSAAICQAPALQISSHSVLALELQGDVPLRVGQSLSAELVYPVYSGATLILSPHTRFTGTVIALLPDRSQRLRSRFNLDFTPFRRPVVRFTQITLRDGTNLPIETEAVSDGGNIVQHVRSSSNSRNGILRREYDAASHMIGSSIALFTAPGRGDRLRNFVWSQLPWHPQRIENGATWTTETQEPVLLPQAPQDNLYPIEPAGSFDNTLSSWTIQATLSDALSSATASTGQTVHATIAAPVFHDDQTVAFPQGATLIGTVTHAQAGRVFGRSGDLRFTFHRVVFPSGAEQAITSSLAGADSPAQDRLSIDSEGTVRSAAKDKFIIPGLLLALAAAPLNPDPGDNNEFLKNAGASNSLGAPGFILGIGLNRAGISAAIGFYGAALSIYERWIKPGDDVKFARNTRVVFTARVGIRPSQPVD